MRRLNVQPNNIWNMDETGLRFQHKAPKVVAEKGTKRLYHRASDSKETVTVVASVNAAGKAMPSLPIVKGKTEMSVTNFATFLGPPEAKWTHQTKGWTDNSLGVEWFKQVFLQNCGKERPILLLLDSHSSHEVLELLELAVEQEIHIFALPPHTTQRLQPLP